MRIWRGEGSSLDAPRSTDLQPVGSSLRLGYLIIDFEVEQGVA